MNFSSVPLSLPGPAELKSYPIQCIVLALTLTLFNLKYLTCQIDYRIIYRWVWVQAYGCRSGLWDLQPCEGAISQHTCLTLVNIYGNRASLLGGTRSPQLSFVLALSGNDGADFQRKQPLLTVRCWSSKVGEHSILGVPASQSRKVRRRQGNLLFLSFVVRGIVLGRGWDPDAGCVPTSVQLLSVLTDFKFSPDPAQWVEPKRADGRLRQITSCKLCPVLSDMFGERN